MRCQTIGRTPTLTSGFGTVSECSRRRVPRPPQKRTTFMFEPFVLELEAKLTAVKGFGEPAGRAALDAAEAGERAECVFGEPGAALLRRETMQEALHLERQILRGVGHEDVRLA